MCQTKCIVPVAPIQNLHFCRIGLGVLCPCSGFALCTVQHRQGLHYKIRLCALAHCAGCTQVQLQLKRQGHRPLFQSALAACTVGSVQCVPYSQSALAAWLPQCCTAVHFAGRVCMSGSWSDNMSTNDPGCVQCTVCSVQCAVA